jgi:hypothetical protein
MIAMEAWHLEHCSETFVANTEDWGSVCLKIRCSPWHPGQDGTSPVPFASITPWMEVLYCA